MISKRSNMWAYLTERRRDTINRCESSRIARLRNRLSPKLLPPLRKKVHLLSLLVRRDQHQHQVLLLLLERR
jgi:hypothetical protein